MARKHSPAAPVADVFPLPRPRARLPLSADKPAHYRLSKATWELILAEYREGATCPALSIKWRVSEHALRKRITQHGSTKRDWGDAQAIEQAKARMEAVVEETAREDRRLAALFVPTEADDEAADPAALARQAMLASGRAMTQRLWAEARALANLAESYARLAERRATATGDVDVEGMDLGALYAILMGDDPRVAQRFAINPDHGHDDPDIELKQAYWDVVSGQRKQFYTEWMRDQHARVRERQAEKEAQEAQGVRQATYDGRAFDYVDEPVED